MSTTPPWTADSSVPADSNTETASGYPISSPAPTPSPAIPIVVTPWTADSNLVTADSDYYTASGYGAGGSPEFPDVPAMPGVPVLARLQPAAVVAAQATTAGINQALNAALGLSGVTFGLNPDFSSLALSPL